MTTCRTNNTLGTKEFVRFHDFFHIFIFFVKSKYVHKLRRTSLKKIYRNTDLTFHVSRYAEAPLKTISTSSSLPDNVMM